MSLRIPQALSIYRRMHHVGGYGDDQNAALVFPKRGLRVIASTGEGWEHVSVSREDRCPTWEELEYVKRLLWAPTDCAMQLHLPVADHISVHPFVLHLWRPIGGGIPRPPAYHV